MYYKDLESDKNQMAAHNAAMKANARARLDAYAKYNKQNKKSDK